MISWLLVEYVKIKETPYFGSDKMILTVYDKYKTQVLVNVRSNRIYNVYSSIVEICVLGAK